MITLLILIAVLSVGYTTGYLTRSYIHRRNAAAFWYDLGIRSQDHTLDNSEIVQRFERWLG